MPVGHVGDSRAYLVKDGTIEQLTQDHTLAVELERQKVANEGAVASAHHVLTRTSARRAGRSRPERCRSRSSRARHSCCAATGCGTWSRPPNRRVVAAEEPEEACRTLVELARARGGPDNITVVIAKAA